MRYSLLFILILTLSGLGFGQTDIHFTNPLATDIILGEYDPTDYVPTEVISAPDEIVLDLLDNVSASNLKDYLIELQQFRTRNTASDTLVTGSGIGAAREWAYEKFESFNQDNGGRLVVSFLQFDQVVCGLDQHLSLIHISSPRDS